MIVLHYCLSQNAKRGCHGPPSLLLGWQDFMLEYVVTDSSSRYTGHKKNDARFWETWCWVVMRGVFLQALAVRLPACGRFALGCSWAEDRKMLLC